MQGQPEGAVIFSPDQKSVSLDSESVVHILFYFIFKLRLLICLFCQPQPPSSPEALKLDLAWRITSTSSAAAEGWGAAFPRVDAENKCHAGALRDQSAG